MRTVLASRSSIRAKESSISFAMEAESGAGLRMLPGSKISDHSHLVSVRLECLPGLKQRLQAGKNTWPSIGAGSVSRVILGPVVMRHRYLCGFGLGHQFDGCA